MKVKPMNFYIMEGLLSVPVLVQSSIDGLFFNLSSHYNLTALYYNPALKIEDVGTLSQLIENNKSLSEDLLSEIEKRSKDNERIKANDLILFFRTLFYVVQESLSIESALEKAINQDDALSEFHFKIYKVIQDAKQST